VIRRISPVWPAAWLGLAMAAGVSARDEYTRTVDRTVTVHAGERVTIENKFGDVNVKTHASPDVVIHADVKASAGDSERARKLAESIDIQIDPSSNGLSIRTKYPEQESWLGSHNNSYSVRYDITVPETAPLDVHNSFGAVRVTGTKAGGTIVNSHGELTFHDGGGAQHLTNSFGRVEVGNVAGDVDLESSFGAVNAQDIKGALARAIAKVKAGQPALVDTVLRPR